MTEAQSKNQARPTSEKGRFPEGYSGEDAEERMRQRRDNPHHGHKTGAYTDIGEGRSGVTTPKKT